MLHSTWGQPLPRDVMLCLPVLADATGYNLAPDLFSLIWEIQRPFGEDFTWLLVTDPAFEEFLREHGRDFLPIEAQRNA